MAVIFDNEDGGPARAGNVTMLSRSGPTGSILTVDAWEGFNVAKAIFTGLRIGSWTNHQFQQTLGSRVYLNVFGNRMTQIQLSGIAFFNNCAGQGQSLLGRLFRPADQRTGISHVIEFYKKNRLSVRAEPLKITIDPMTVYECYLHSMQADMVGDQGNAFRLYQFNLGLSALDDVTRTIVVGDEFIFL